jgi:hypothetical protein
LYNFTSFWWISCAKDFSWNIQVFRLE